MAQTPRKFRLSFNAALWLLGSAIAFWLICWPMVMDVWAARTWTKTSCHINDSNAGMFSYTVGDTHYLSGRRDFWVVKTGTHVVPGELAPLDENGLCYVNPHDPMDCVLHLDSATDWGNSRGRLAGAGVLAGGVVLITFAGRRKTPAPPPPNADVL